MANPFKRGLSESFLNKFKNNGIFVPIIEKIKEHNKSQAKKLSLNIRGNYINIYYNGGCLAKVSSQTASWDANYYKHIKVEEGEKSKEILERSYNSLKGRVSKSTKYPRLSYQLKSSDDVSIFLNDWQHLVKIMEIFREKKERDLQQNVEKERALQQNVEFENNNSGDKFIIVDTEYAISKVITSQYGGFEKKTSPQLDMVALEKLENNTYQLVLIENKVSYKSSSGKSGISDHLKDMYALISNETLIKYFKENIQEIANQLVEIGILSVKEQIIVDLNPHKIKTVFMMSQFWTKEGVKETSDILDFKKHKINFVEYNKVMNIEFQFLGNFKNGIEIDNKYIYESACEGKYTFTLENIANIYK